MIGKELIAASATPLILSVLRGGESYGYEIIRTVRALSNDRVDWSEGMVYPALKRLEQRGLLSSRWAQSDEGPRRKYYALTERGRAALVEEQSRWMTVHTTLQALWEGPCTT